MFDLVLLNTPAKVEALERELFKMPQATIVTEHTFMPGVYERKITIPAWTVLTGAVHKTAYKVRVDTGRIAVTADNGIRIVEGPCEFTASAGVQRVGRVFGAEVVWTDVYENPDDCRDIAVLEDRLYIVPECGLASSRTSVQRDRIDFTAFVRQLGITQAQLDDIVQIESDMIEMPAGHAVELRASPVHGIGLFATAPVLAGEFICPGRLDGMRTPAGRYINHSVCPNVEPVKMGDDIYAVALRDVMAGDELLVDYRASMLVNFGLVLQGETS